MIANKNNFVFKIMAIFLSSSLVSACSFLFGEMVTFHKPCAVWKQPIRIAGDNKGNVYAFYDWYTLSLFKNNQKAKDYYYPDLKNERDIHCMDYFDNYIFLSTSSRNTINDCKIEILNMNMESVKQIDSHDYIKYFVCEGNSIYCLCQQSKKLYIKRYFLDSFEEELLWNNVEIGHHYTNEETELYLNESYELFSVKIKTFFHGSTKSFDCWHNEIGRINCYVDYNKIIIHLSDKEFIYDSMYEKEFLYNNVYIDGDFLIFAIREYVENKQCPPGTDNCFCHFGSSTLLRYDLKKEKFLEPIKYEPRTILIDYDFDGAQYYFDGAFYNHGSKIRECKKISIDETVKVDATIREYNLSEDERLRLLFFNDVFYGA